MEDPQNAWFVTETPIKMDDDLGVPPFQETSITGYNPAFNGLVLLGKSFTGNHRYFPMKYGALR